MAHISLTTQSGLAYRLSHHEAAWLSQFSNQDVALHCIRYALAINSLDAGWLVEHLDDDVVYTTSIVDDFLVRGKDAVLSFFSNRISTVRAWRHSKPLRVELARNPADGSPCCLHYQRDNEYSSGLGALHYWLSIQSANGSIRLMDTGIEPSADTMQASTIFPGISRSRIAREQRQRPQKVPYGLPLLFEFHIVEGDMSWLEAGQEIRHWTGRTFPHTEYRLTSHRPPSDDMRRWLYMKGLPALPCLEVSTRGMTILRIAGPDFNDSLLSAFDGLVVDDTRRRVPAGSATALLENGDGCMGPALQAVELYFRDRRVVKELAACLLSPEPLVARRAAYALDRLSFLRPANVQPYLEMLLSVPDDERFNGMLRHVARMLPRFRLNLEERYHAEKLLLNFSLHSDPALRIFALRSITRFARQNRHLREFAGPFIYNHVLCRSGNPRVVREAEHSLDLIEALVYRDEERWEGPGGHA